MSSTTAVSINPFRKAPYIDLIIVRFLVTGFSIYSLFFWIDGGLRDALALPEQLYSPLLITKILLAPIGWGTLPPDSLILWIYKITIVFAILSFIGWRTNISLFFLTLCMVLLQSFEYSFGEIHHREAVLMIALLALAFSPCGRYYSIDSIRGKGFNKLLDSPMSTSTHSEYAYWPIFVCKVFLALMYLSAIFNKLTVSGIGWANGYTLQSIMAMDGLRWGSELSIWFSQQHVLLLLGQIVVVVFQSTFWLVLFFPRLGWIYYPLGLGFHILIFVTLKAPFFHWMLLYFLFIPYSNVYRAIRKEIKYSEILTAS